jgi:hypothetical protein
MPKRYQVPEFLPSVNQQQILSPEKGLPHSPPILLKVPLLIQNGFPTKEKLQVASY